MHEEKEQIPLKINITVENFGPIEKADIDLRPLTVFVGESNTGKTYFATLIYALQQALEGIVRVPMHQSTIVLLKESRFRSNRDPDIETQETLKKLNRVGRSFKYQDLPDWLCKHVHNYLNNSTNFTDQLKRCFDLESIDEIRRFTQENHELLISLNVREGNDLLWHFHLQSTGENIDMNGAVNRDIVLRQANQNETKQTLEIDDLLLLFRNPKYHNTNFYFLPAIHGGLMEMHSIINGSLVERATRGDIKNSPNSTMLTGMVADFLKHIIHYQENKNHSREIATIAEMLEEELLQGKINVSRPAGLGYPQILFKPNDATEAIRLNRSSAMVLELAPLVLFLRSLVKPGDTLIIEEPESHLHPKAQTQMAIVLARLVRAGVRVIITTHSDWLLQQIGNLIREGELKKHIEESVEVSDRLLSEEVGVWWFHRDKPIEEIPFDRIEGIEPKDYEDVADSLYNSFVDLERQFLNEGKENKNE